MFTKEDNQVLDRILNARKTCRAFAENVPTDDEIKEVIQAGCIAPYASIDAKAVTPFRHFFVIKKQAFHRKVHNPVKIPAYNNLAFS